MNANKRVERVGKTLLTRVTKRSRPHRDPLIDTERNQREKKDNEGDLPG